MKVQRIPFWREAMVALALGAGTACLLPVQANPAGNLAPVVAVPTDFSNIVERYGSAVVNITVLGRSQRGNSNDPFFEFFRRFGAIPQQQGPQVVQGLGSGFLISTDGLILTNAHVIDQGQEVQVKLTDRREFKARVLGADRLSDVAVLKIEGKDLPSVKLGNPNGIRVGEPVLAIGSPFGFENSVSSGIISAKSRSLQNDSVVPFIQTDVAVNPGNSGGPLFNLRGEVIGINSQIYSKTGGFQGLSFAIPIDIAMKIQDQITRTGKVTRGRLGVSTQEVTQALADSLGLKKPQGGLVNWIDRGGPAERAGLRAGDVIVRLGDTEIRQSADLPGLISNLKPGSTVTLEVVRNGASRQLSATVGKIEDRTVAPAAETAPGVGRFEVVVRALSRNESRQLGVSGALLVEQAAGTAAQAGIGDGDIILAVNGTPVATPEQMQRIVQRANKSITVLVQRDNSRIYIPVNLN
ncbi:MAG: hypothetical protein RL748_76 [Pseudomonadota bacterium]